MSENPPSVVKRARSVSVTRKFKIDGHSHSIKCLASAKSFEKLATAIKGISDRNLGVIFRFIILDGKDAKLLRSSRRGKGNLLRRSAWKTATWLALGLLPLTEDGFRRHTESAKQILEAMRQDGGWSQNPKPREAVGFLVLRHWLKLYPEWPGKTPPTDVEGFWKEVFRKEKNWRYTTYLLPGKFVEGKVMTIQQAFDQLVSTILDNKNRETWILG